jgi:hypothetical protein
MMGNKKLATIRQELKDALEKEEQDPIQWLEERIAAGRREGSGTEVLESLKRVLERGTTGKPGKRRAKVKR